MKIHILYTFQDSPWGGGNQFLKALREYFIECGVYVDDPFEADVILINSYPFQSETGFFKKIYKIRRYIPEICIIHRVDGPVSLIRGTDITIDTSIFKINQFLADGTIFQSNWSKNECQKLGIKSKLHEVTISNASSPDIYFSNNSAAKHKKIKIIATSWSGNLKKGFDIYTYLDWNLDFKRYDMTFVGNSPVVFDNITHVEPLDSSALAEQLRSHDIFITASKNDPCSNSVIEALSCGLPVVAMNDGGHPEIVKQAGTFFEGADDVIEKIDHVAAKLEYFIKNIDVPGIDEIGQKYTRFFGIVYKSKQSGQVLSGPANSYSKIVLIGQIFILKIMRSIKVKIYRLINNHG